MAVDDVTTQMRAIVNPLPDQTPTAVLGRRRFLGQNSLADPVYPAVTPWTFDPWAALRSDAVVSRMLKTFKGFRADLRLNILCRAGPGTYGMYTVSWCYGTPQAADLPDVLNWDTYVCDVSTSESLEFVIPFRWPYEYRTASFSEQTNAIILHINNLMSKSVDSGSTITDLAVYGSFENIETGFYVEDSAVEFQSEKSFDAPAVTTSTAASIALGLAAMNTIFPPLSNKLNILGDAPSTVEDKKAKSSSGKARGVRQSYYGDLATVEPEPGIPSLDVLNDAPGLVSMDHMGMHGNMSFEEIGKLPGFMAWSNYLSTDAVGTKFTYAIGLNSTASSFDRVWPVSWAAYYARFFRYYRGEHKLVLHFACSPLVSARFSVHVDYIYASNYQDAGLASVPSLEMPSEVFLIKGSETKIISIPWNQKMAWRSCRDCIALVTLRVVQPPTTYSAAVTTVGVLATHSVDQLQFASIQHQYRTRHAFPPSALRDNEDDVVEPQSNLRAIHEQTGGERFDASKHERIKSYMHVIPTLHDLLRRWDDNFIAGVAEPITALDFDFPDNQVEFEESALMVPAIQPFAFMTGTVENRMIFTGVGTPEAVVVNDTVAGSLRVGNGMSKTIVPGWPVLEYTTPYLADAPIVSTASDIISGYNTKLTTVIVNYGGATISQCIVRVGEDFQVFYPNRLPNHTFWAVPQLVP